MIAHEGSVMVRLGAVRRIRAVPAALLVAIAATVNFLGGLGEPAHPIWDESYYLTAVERYEEGIAQFASHPPLALMLIAGGDALLHPNRGLHLHPIGVDKKVSGEDLPKGYSFAGVRLASGVFSVVGSVLFFALMLALTGSPLAALVLSNLFVFQNAFVVHFRAAQLDGFQVAFSIAAILAFVKAAQRGARSAPWLDLAYGASCGLALMVKLNAAALGMLGVLVIAQRIALGWRNGSRASLLARTARDGALMAGGCLAVVVLVLTAHVLVSPRPPDGATPAGRKDLGFITPIYSQYLHRKRALSPAVLIDAGRDYYRFIIDDFDGVPRTDSNGSAPILWPLHRGTINYRWDSDDDHTAYVQLAGNPVAWFLSTLALVAAAALLVAAAVRPVPASLPWRRSLMAMLLVQYIAFMAVHAYIGLQRVMYLYHYFIALVLALALVPLVISEAEDRWPGLRARRGALGVTMLVLVWVGFLYYAPLTFHWPITHRECEWENVLQHVVNCQ
ncbi:MAG TPA: phospholipid carrier-dependent glycosyltransferase, partial [Steroidobacteraceae bacterium]|nr:phospholipid carrier-dependent glycosyltransferase [Steroidobacteraceae bacterium]